jgi:hypothetical protein
MIRLKAAINQLQEWQRVYGDDIPLVYMAPGKNEDLLLTAEMYVETVFHGDRAAQCIVVKPGEK